MSRVAPTSLTLSGANGSNPKSCKYKIDRENLALDDGAGRSCIDSERVHMAVSFKRAQPPSNPTGGGLHSGSMKR